MKNTKHLAIISSTLIIISLILGSSFKNAFEHLNTIKITGSAKKDFVSDIIFSIVRVNMLFGPFDKVLKRNGHGIKGKVSLV